MSNTINIKRSRRFTDIHGFDSEIDNLIKQIETIFKNLPAQSEQNGGNGEVIVSGVESFNGRTGVVTPQSGDYTKTMVGLGSVTNDAQLKRSANDFSQFSEKVIPVGADKLLIEDSEDGGSKKYLQLTNIPGGGGGASVNYTEVTTLTQLVEIANPNDGDWAYVSQLGFYHVYLDGLWRRIGSLSPVSSAYGETIHYDASAISGKSDGEAITEWADISGNGHDAISVNTGPIFKTNIVNGYPVVRFSDANDNSIMRIPNKILANASDSELTVIVVSKASTIYSPIIATLTPPTYTGWMFTYNDAVTKMSYFHNAHLTYTFTNQFNVLWFKRSGATSVVAGVNSTTNQLSGNPTGFSPNTVEDYTQIGSYRNGGNAAYRLGGDIAEMLIFEEAISDTLLGEIIDDLKTKFNIT